MSRGHGRTERFILEVLGRDAPPRPQAWHSVRQIAAEIDGPEPGPGIVASVRRAVKKLADERVVDLWLRPRSQPYVIWQARRYVIDPAVPGLLRLDEPRGHRLVYELCVARWLTEAELTAMYGPRPPSLEELEGAIGARPRSGDDTAGSGPSHRMRS